MIEYFRLRLFEWVRGMELIEKAPAKINLGLDVLYTNGQMGTMNLRWLCRVWTYRSFDF